MLIDTQLHLVDPLRFPFDRSGAGYMPNDDETGDLPTLLATLDAQGVARGVLVQPSAYGTDNAAVLDALERAGDRLRGIVMEEESGRSPDRGVAGVRLNLTDYARHGPAAALLIGAGVLRRGLILQVQARPPDLAALMPGLPDGPVILDHLGRPDPERADDLAKISSFAGRADTWLKVSGGFRLAQAWQTPHQALRDLVEDWPADRVIWGSDWPFLNTGATRPTYADVMAWAATLTDLERASANAARLFGWGDG